MIISNTPILYLIDGSAYVYRAFHAIRGLANSKGLPTNAIFGFTNMMTKLIKEKKPDYWAIAFDVKGPTFRHDLYGQYKANRPPMPDDLSVQIPYIKKIAKAFNMAIIEKEGYEADDLIGTLKCKAEDAGFEVIMVTGDKDFLQLVTKKSSIWDPMKEKTIDFEKVLKIYGIEPNRIIDIMGLMGDKSDNIPGAPGIGPKTAAPLIKEYGTIENLYENIDKLTNKKLKEKLISFKDDIILSKKLVTIKTDTNIEFDSDAFGYGEPDKKALISLFDELEFKKLKHAFLEKNDLAEKKYKTVFTMEQLQNLATLLEKSEIFAIDTETTSCYPYIASLVGLSFSCEENKAFYIPIGHDYRKVPNQLRKEEVLDLLKPVLENDNIKKVGQNIKYDMMVLTRCGINLSGVIFDTMIASYLINPSAGSHSLEKIAADFLNHKMITFEEVAGKGKEASFAKVAIEKAYIYACEDADITFAAYNSLKSLIKKEGLDELFYKTEMPLVSVIADMELKGIRVDRKKLEVLSASFSERLESIGEKIYEIAGEEFNINSSQQLGEILFEKLKLSGGKKTKKTKKYSTDVNVLKQLAATHELPGLILEHRTLAKLKSTYTDALVALINPETERIHTSYNQSVTATGRLSSSSPNLQNIPIRTEEGREIRKAFIPKKGYELVSADYSQIELRILAHYSEDSLLIDAFCNDEDIHERTATEIFNVFPSFVTDDLRRYAKTINFGIIYGMSPYGLAKELMIGNHTAKVYIDNYFAKYKGVKSFIDRAIEEAGESKKTSTLFGRIRYLPDINSKNANARKFAERTAVNTPIQGTAADIIKLAMIDINKIFKEKEFASSMLLSVHDELIFEIEPSESESAISIVKERMENIYELKVPLKVNIEKGDNWGFSTDEKKRTAG